MLAGERAARPTSLRVAQDRRTQEDKQHRLVSPSAVELKKCPRKGMSPRARMPALVGGAVVGDQAAEHDGPSGLATTVVWISQVMMSAASGTVWLLMSTTSVAHVELDRVALAHLRITLRMTPMSSRHSMSKGLVASPLSESAAVRNGTVLADDEDAGLLVVERVVLGVDSRVGLGGLGRRLDEKPSGPPWRPNRQPVGGHRGRDEYPRRRQDVLHREPRPPRKG